MKSVVSQLMLLAVFVSGCSGSASVRAAQAPSASPVVTLAPAVSIVSSAPEVDIASVSEEGYTVIDQTALGTALAESQPGALSDGEAAALAYMREEEKLAHDVYVTLVAQWQMPVFQNIANSELTHTEAVRALLDRYGLPDPASAEVGVFADQTLQSLYDQLVQQGGQSLAEALKVGAAIEEIDILDLEKRLAQTDRADITLVFQNLMKGSRNHLRSFVSTLQRQSGEAYQPQHLGPDAYQAIIGAPIESGGPGSSGRGGRGNGRP